MVNQLVCKNQSSPTTCKPHLSTPRKVLKKQAEQEKETANGHRVHTAQKLTQP